MQLDGVLGDVRVTTQSGSVRVADMSSADLRTTSGSVEVQHCEGSCRITTTSGSVRIDGAGDADVSGGSGTVRVTGVTTRVRTVSGTVKLVAGGDVSVETVSGTIAITVPPHLHPRVVFARFEAAEDRCRRRGRQRRVGAFAQWLDHRSTR